MTSDVAQTASGTSRASRRRGMPSTMSTASRYTSMNARRSAYPSQLVGVRLSIPMTYSTNASRS